MAYDVELAARLRERLAQERGLSERKMFGGLAFLLDDHMAVAASEGGILLRCDLADTETLLADPLAEPMVMRGREMNGWLRVRLSADDSDEVLDRWIAHGVAFVRTIDAG